MEIHKPKPWHGWREFLKEVGIIVLGVLIALGAEQGAEALHWRHRVEQTRDQLHEELTRDAVSSWTWLSSSQCQEAEIANLEKALFAARATGRVEKVAPYSPDLWLWTDGAWSNAQSLQVADHLSTGEMRGYEVTYFFPRQLMENGAGLNELAAELAPLRNGLDRVTPAEADGFLKTVDRIRELKARQDLAATRMLQASAKLGVSLTQRQRRDAFANAQSDYGACLVDPSTVMQRLDVGAYSPFATRS